MLFFYQDPEDLVEAEQINGQIAARPGDSGGPVYSDQGGSVIAKGTTTRVAGSRLGFLDFITANRDFGVEIANPSGDIGVVFFQDIQFGGAASQPLARGAYTLSQLQAMGVQNDWASSVRIPSGFTVIMFQHNEMRLIRCFQVRTTHCNSFVIPCIHSGLPVISPLAPHVLPHNIIIVYGATPIAMNSPNRNSGENK